MANTGFLNPVSAFTVSAGRGGTRPWVSGGNTGSIFSAARLSDNLRVVIDDISAAVIPFPLFVQFDLSAAGISALNLVDVQGFTVRYERGANSTAVSVNETWIQIISGAGTGVQFLGTTANSNTGNWTTTDTSVTAGGSGTMFGLTTADASVNRLLSDRFGFAVNIRYGAGTTLTSAIAQIDQLQLQVHYKRVNTTDVVSPEFGYEVMAQDGRIFTPWLTPTTSKGADNINLNTGITFTNPTQVTSFNSAAATAANDSLGTSWYHWGGFNAALSAFLTAEISAEIEVVYKIENFTLSTDPKAILGVIGLSAVVCGSRVSADMSSTTWATAAFGGVSGDTLPLRRPDVEHENFGVYILSTGMNSDKIIIDLLRVRYGYLAEGGVTDNVTISQNAAASFEVFGAEFDWEARSLAFTKNIVAVGAEFDWEASSVALVRNLIVNSAEFDHEIQSTAIGPVLVVQSAEFGWEGRSAALLQFNNIIVQSGEWDHEVQSADLTWNIVVQSAEFDHEINSVSIADGAQTIVVQSAEFDWEARSLALALNVVVQSAEFDYEVRSVALANTITVTPGEWDYEVASAQISLNVQPQSAEFGWEATSVAVAQITVIAVQSAEFDWEGRSVALVANLVAQSAEFDWEARSVQLLANFIVNSAEFGWEAQSVEASRNIIVNSAEFGYEAGSPQITSAITSPGFEKGWEVSDVSLTNNLRVTNAEFDREIQSVSISKVIPVTNAEWGWEGMSARLTRNLVPNEYERGWEAESLDLNQFYSVSAGAIGPPEFDWEVGGAGPTLRQFVPHPGTPPDRIKRCRQF